MPNVSWNSLLNVNETAVIFSLILMFSCLIAPVVNLLFSMARRKSATANVCTAPPMVTVIVAVLGAFFVLVGAVLATLAEAGDAYGLMGSAAAALVPGAAAAMGTSLVPGAAAAVGTSLVPGAAAAVGDAYGLMGSAAGALVPGAAAAVGTSLVPRAALRASSAFMFFSYGRRLLGG